MRPPVDQDRLSARQLSEFLRKLSHLYATPETGNPILSASLLDLAKSLATHGIPGSKTQQSRARDSVESALTPNDAAKLSAEQIAALIDDPNTSKATLITVARYRFSVPHAALEKRKLADVRDALRAFFAHEKSIDILTDEAQRQGLARKS